MKTLPDAKKWKLIVQQNLNESDTAEEKEIDSHTFWVTELQKQNTISATDLRKLRVVLSAHNDSWLEPFVADKGLEALIEVNATQENDDLQLECLRCLKIFYKQ
eukprot:TRINITY_DN4473_c0_g1_i1.p2 TRINITY_DN4473_c0_g1~~TRINITY_DN4473_c0_g1_i1.p2  ORF type:complete len:104 (-),score=18.11 TRINITY_DN4473_c0_g1_i1:499-810(-)